MGWRAGFFFLFFAAGGGHAEKTDSGWGLEVGRSGCSLLAPVAVKKFTGPDVRRDDASAPPIHCTSSLRPSPSSLKATTNPIKRTQGGERQGERETHLHSQKVPQRALMIINNYETKAPLVQKSIHLFREGEREREREGVVGGWLYCRRLSSSSPEHLDANQNTGYI